jgi:hypothetical protein
MKPVIIIIANNSDNENMVNSNNINVIIENEKK